MDVQIAEAAPECEVLFRAQGLVAEEEDEVLHPGVVNLGQHLGIKRLGEVDALDHGADCWCQGFYVDVVVGNAATSLTEWMVSRSGPGAHSPSEQMALPEHEEGVTAFLEKREPQFPA